MMDETRFLKQYGPWAVIAGASEGLGAAYAEQLARLGINVVLVARRLARRFEPPVVLQDLGLPPDPEGVSEGMQTLLETLKLAPSTKVIVVTGQLDKQNAVKAVGLGAYDFYQKPVDTDVLKLLVRGSERVRSSVEGARTVTSGWPT